MKRTLLIIIAALLSITALNAQPRAIGARLGYGAEVSYQHYLNGNFIEADLGTSAFRSLQLHVVHNWVIATPVWTTKGDWLFYGGAGLGTGYCNFTETRSYSEGPMYGNVTIDRKYGFLGVAGQLGLEYTFWFPLQISVDIRPVIGPKFGDGGGLYNDYKAFFIPFLSVRYMF